MPLPQPRFGHSASRDGIRDDLRLNHRHAIGFEDQLALRLQQHATTGSKRLTKDGHCAGRVRRQFLWHGWRSLHYLLLCTGITDQLHEAVRCCGWCIKSCKPVITEELARLDGGG